MIMNDIRYNETSYKEITFDETFLDTNLQSDDVIHNTKIGEFFTVHS